jgi:DnaJ-class molecular chaperone
VSNNTIPFIRENEEGEEVTDELPTRWAICSACEGEGKSSAYLGAITQEDRERDWSPEEFEGYMNGDYDKTCEACQGTGKVREVDEAVLPKALLAEWCQAEDEARRERFAEEALYRAEMGYRE